jgi:chromosome segregation ATPase
MRFHQFARLLTKKLQADLLESTRRASELEARVGGLERENDGLHAEVEAHVEQLEELQALREEAAGWEAQLAESEDALAQVGFGAALAEFALIL